MYNKKGIGLYVPINAVHILSILTSASPTFK